MSLFINDAIKKNMYVVMITDHDMFYRLKNEHLYKHYVTRLV